MPTLFDIFYLLRVQLHREIPLFRAGAQLSVSLALTTGPAPTGGQAMRPSFSASPSFWIATRLPSATLCAFATFVLTFVALQQSNEVIRQQNQEQVYEWLEKSGLGKHKETVFQHGKACPRNFFFFLHDIGLF